MGNGFDDAVNMGDYGDAQNDELRNHDQTGFIDDYYHHIAGSLSPWFLAQIILTGGAVGYISITRLSVPCE